MQATSRFAQSDITDTDTLYIIFVLSIYLFLLFLFISFHYMLQPYDLGLYRAAKGNCPTLRASIYLNGYTNILIAQQGQIAHFVFDWSVIIQSRIILNSEKLN